MSQIKVERSGPVWSATIDATVRSETWRGPEDVIWVSETCIGHAGDARVVPGVDESYEKKIEVMRYHWPKDRAVHGTMSTFIRGGRSMSLTLEEAREVHRQLGIALALNDKGEA